MTREEKFQRLNTLRVLVEGHDEGVYHDIWERCEKSLDKSTNFIIRLSSYEKECLSYKLESDFNSDYEVEVLNSYIK